MILNIVIQNSGIDIYKKMYEILSPFYKKFNFVKTYFIEYDEFIDEDFLIEDDVIKLKGEESMIPGILQKTIDALLLLRNLGIDYNWLIRSNVSTVVNFDVLYNLLESKSCPDYFGACVFKIDNLDLKSGIVDQKYFGNHFAAGTMIGLSNKYVNLLLKKRHKLNYDLIDDVAIGVFVNEYISSRPVHFFQDNLLVNVSNDIHSINDISEYNKKNSPVAWRNKGIDRGIDILNMMNIVNFLTNKSLGA